jgi:hypothetical protein
VTEPDSGAGPEATTPTPTTPTVPTTPTTTPTTMPTVPTAPTPLAQAVGQAAGVANLWTSSLGSWAVSEAALVSSGKYRLGDLLTAQVRLARVVVDAGVKSALLVPNMLAILSDDVGEPGKDRIPPGHVREHRLRLDLGVGTSVRLDPSALKGELYRRVIPADRVRVRPEGPFVGSAAGPVEVTVQINIGGVPNDIYVGELRRDDEGSPVELRLAIDELGEPPP